MTRLLFALQVALGTAALGIALGLIALGLVVLTQPGVLP